MSSQTDSIVRQLQAVRNEIKQVEEWRGPGVDAVYRELGECEVVFFQRATGEKGRRQIVAYQA